MLKILITAGPTREAIDPVRFITNHSSGKMGYALAEAAVKKGFQATLISGPVNLTPPDGLADFVPVISAAEMAEAVTLRFADMDAVIMCAAVADYRPVSYSDSKIKKKDGHLFLELERTEDILKTLGCRKKSHQTLIGFAAETDHLATYAREKLQKKNLDWIVANQVGKPGQGFQADTNAVTLYSAQNEQPLEIPLCSKKLLAEKILQKIFPDHHIL